MSQAAFRFVTAIEIALVARGFHVSDEKVSMFARASVFEFFMALRLDARLNFRGR